MVGAVGKAPGGQGLRPWTPVKGINVIPKDLD